VPQSDSVGSPVPVPGLDQYMPHIGAAVFFAFRKWARQAMLREALAVGEGMSQRAQEIAYKAALTEMKEGDADHVLREIVGSEDGITELYRLSMATANPTATTAEALKIVRHLGIEKAIALMYEFCDFLEDDGEGKTDAEGEQSSPPPPTTARA